eukprot:gene9772-10807_t
MEPQRLLLGLLYCTIYLASHLLGLAAEPVTRGFSLLVAWILLGQLLLASQDKDKQALRILSWVVWVGALVGVGLWRGVEALNAYAWLAPALSLPWMAAEVWTALHFFDSLRRGAVVSCVGRDGEARRGSWLAAAACLLLYCAALYWQMTVSHSLADKYPRLHLAIAIVQAWSWLVGLVGLVSGLSAGLLLPASVCVVSSLYTSFALHRTTATFFGPLLVTALVLSYETIPNHFYSTITPRWCRRRRRRRRGSGKKGEEDEGAPASREKERERDEYGAEGLPLLHSSSAAESEQGGRLDGKLHLLLLLTANGYFLQLTDPLGLMLCFYASLVWIVYSCFLVVRYLHRRRYSYWFRYHYYRLPPPPPATCPTRGDVLEV